MLQFHPTSILKQYLIELFGTSRYIYNYCIDEHQAGRSSISLTELAKQPNHEWMLNIPITIRNAAVLMFEKDLTAKVPLKYKSKKSNQRVDLPLNCFSLNNNMLRIADLDEPTSLHKGNIISPSLISVSMIAGYFYVADISLPIGPSNLGLDV